MEAIVVELKKDKETKNTVRYSAEDAGEYGIDSLYIAQAALEKPYPAAIKLTVEAA